MMMDQQQQQRMQMHPGMYGHMPHSNMMPPHQGGMPGGPPGMPGQPGPQRMMGGYHMQPHMMNNSQNSNYPGAPQAGPRMPMPMTSHSQQQQQQQPYPHSQQQQQQPTQQQTLHHNVPASSSAPTHPSGIKKDFLFRFWIKKYFLKNLVKSELDEKFEVFQHCLLRSLILMSVETRVANWSATFKIITT